MSPKEITPEEIQRIYETKTYLLNHLHQKFTVAQLARHAALSEEKFREGFYKAFHYPISEYIKEARMQLGYFLLLHTSKTFKEIAWLTGYRQTKNFMTAFKQFFQVTAGFVRRQGTKILP